MSERIYSWYSKRRRVVTMKIWVFVVVCGIETNVSASNPFSHISQSFTKQMSTLPVPNFITRGGSVRFLQHRLTTLNASTATKKRRKNNTGSYYGIREDIFFTPFNKKEETQREDSSQSSDKSLSSKPRQRLRKLKDEDPSRSPAVLADVMGETLIELREMREDIAALRDEMRTMKKEIMSSSEIVDFDGQIEDSYSEENSDNLAHQPQGLTGFVARKRRQKEFDNIGMDIQKWAERLIFEEQGEANGWKEVQCSKLFKNKFNKRDNIKCYLKWLPDSRGEHADINNEGRTFPCVKCIAKIDAPLKDVCAYLSDEKRVPEYNDLVTENRDVDEISPHSKICWSSSPQILFIKPRDFITFCHFHWKKDGTQVVVNQSVGHDDFPPVEKEGHGKYCRAYALRGANFLSKDPDDPNKTIFSILSHADPGGGVPAWAIKTAINAIAPIEPFKLFHRIESRVIESKEDYANRAAPLSVIPGRSSIPGGLSQMGYACFWPNGGGFKEGYQHHVNDNHQAPLMKQKTESGNDQQLSQDIAEKTDNPAPVEPISSNNDEIEVETIY